MKKSTKFDLHGHGPQTLAEESFSHSKQSRDLVLKNQYICWTENPLNYSLVRAILHNLMIWDFIKLMSLDMPYN